jgi:signal peptidase I
MSAQTETTSPPRHGWLKVMAIGRNPLTTFIRILILVAGCFVVFKFIMLPLRVTGISMEPTYKDRSINFLNRLAYLTHEPRRGDVVSIRYAGPHVVLMKRIVGLPGETIEFIHGTVFINGSPLAEPYKKNPSDWTLPPEMIGQDEYFVVGDNREMPPHDHVFGRVERARILGKVLL